MKQCTKCNRVYDEELSFCLIDGTPLVIKSDEERTLVMQQPTARKKSRFLLWLGLTGLVILAGSGLLVGSLFYVYNKQDESIREKKQVGVNVSPSPKLKAVPTSTLETKSPIKEASPEIEEEKTPLDNNETEDTTETEDATPIGWDTTASGFKGEVGQTYKFQCPEEGTEHAIYGSDIYTYDSSICTAATHAGIISLAQGGTVTIEYRPGRSVYGSTVRNGIKSRTWGEIPRSFVVR